MTDMSDYVQAYLPARQPKICLCFAFATIVQTQTHLQRRNNVHPCPQGINCNVTRPPQKRIFRTITTGSLPGFRLPSTSLAEGLGQEVHKSPRKKAAS